VTDAGANAQLRVLGNPEHVSATALLKLPDSGLTVTLILPEDPGAMFMADGAAPNFRLAAFDVLPQFRLNFTPPEI
jgi:hypothetical protein